MSRQRKRKWDAGVCRRHVVCGGWGSPLSGYALPRPRRVGEPSLWLSFSCSNAYLPTSLVPGTVDAPGASEQNRPGAFPSKASDGHRSGGLWSTKHLVPGRSWSSASSEACSTLVTWVRAWAWCPEEGGIERHLEGGGLGVWNMRSWVIPALLGRQLGEW